MDQELEKLARKVMRIAEQRFNRDEGLHPLFYGVKDNNTRFVFDPHRLGLAEEYDERTKTVIVDMVQMLFALYSVKRYVYVSEAWALFTEYGATAEEIAAAVTIGASRHPKRVEIIAIEAEDLDGNKIHGHQSIIRPAGGAPYLDDDLTLKDSSGWETTGRFTGLLEFRKFRDNELKEDK